MYMEPVILMGLEGARMVHLKLSYEGGKPQRGGKSFLVGVDLSRHHVLTKSLPFPRYFTSLY